MANLVAKSAFDGCQLPYSIGSLTLSERSPANIQWVHIGTTGAPGRTGATGTTGASGTTRSAGAAAFKNATGVGFPAPARATGNPAGRAIWFGNNQALWTGDRLAAHPGFTLVDQTDAWGVVELAGAQSRLALNHLSPVDLRASAFKTGHTARTMIGHMTCSMTAVGKDRIEIMVFRSMAQTAFHEISRAMRQVSATTSDQP